MASFGQDGAENNMREQIKSSGDYLVNMAAEQFGFEDYLERMKQWSSAHPLIATFIAMSAVLSLVPLLSFLTFVVVSLVFGFLMLLIIEGTIITVSGFFFLLVLGGCLTISLGFTMFLTVSYKILGIVFGILNQSWLFWSREKLQNNPDSSVIKDSNKDEYVKEE